MKLIIIIILLISILIFKSLEIRADRETDGKSNKKTGSKIKLTRPKVVASTDSLDSSSSLVPKSENKDAKKRERVYGHFHINTTNQGKFTEEEARAEAEMLERNKKVQLEKQAEDLRKKREKIRAANEEKKLKKQRIMAEKMKGKKSSRQQAVESKSLEVGGDLKSSQLDHEPIDALDQRLGLHSMVSLDSENEDELASHNINYENSVIPIWTANTRRYDHHTIIDSSDIFSETELSEYFPLLNLEREFPGSKFIQNGWFYYSRLMEYVKNVDNLLKSEMKTFDSILEKTPFEVSNIDTLKSLLINNKKFVLLKTMSKSFDSIIRILIARCEKIKKLNANELAESLSRRDLTALYEKECPDFDLAKKVKVELLMFLSRIMHEEDKLLKLISEITPEKKILPNFDEIVSDPKPKKAMFFSKWPSFLKRSNSI